MADFVVNPKSISQAAIKADLITFISAAPDAAKWKDFFASQTGLLLIDTLSGVSAFLAYNVIVARREAFPQHAKNLSSVIGYAESVGYSAFRGRNPVLKLNVTPTTTGVWEKWKILGAVKDQDMILTAETVVNAGTPITVFVILGTLQSEDITVTSETPQSFRYTQALLSDDVRVYLNTVEVETSERLLDMINEKFVLQSNAVGSVDVMYLNLDNYAVRYTIGDTMSVRWVQRKDLTFLIGDVVFDFGAVNTKEIFATFQAPEGIETIRVNAPLFNETQYTIRGRNDYLKIFKLLDADILDTSGRDVSPAVVELFYVRNDLGLFTALEVADFVTQLSAPTVRPFGVAPPLISHPEIVFLALSVVAELTATGNIVADVATIIDQFETALGQALKFSQIENLIERKSYVQIARVAFKTSAWAPSTRYRRGARITPITPTLGQSPFVYQFMSKLYKSAAVEPAWPANPLDGALVFDENAILSAGTKAKVVYEGVTYSANDNGVAGNNISLIFNGTDTVKKVVDTWNNANPENTLDYVPKTLAGHLSASATRTLTGGTEPVDDPPAGGVQASALYGGVLFRAVLPGTIGNGISLTFNGTSSVQDIVTAWNLAHPSNTITFVPSSAAASIPSSGSASLAGGANPGPGFYGVGTGLVWEVLPKVGTPAAWTANTAYAIGDAIVPTSLPPGWTDKMAVYSDTLNRAAKDVESLTAHVIYGGTVFTAFNPGALGNNIALVFDGVLTVSAVIAQWNTDNPDNKVTFFPSGNGSNVPTAGTAQLADGGGVRATIVYDSVTFGAGRHSDVGNMIEITFTGFNTVQVAVDNWNFSNPTNPLLFLPPSATTTVPPAGTVTLADGACAIKKEPAWPMAPGFQC